jgi:hypothetical protein
MTFKTVQRHQISLIPNEQPLYTITKTSCRYFNHYQIANAGYSEKHNSLKCASTELLAGKVKDEFAAKQAVYTVQDGVQCGDGI